VEEGDRHSWHLSRGKDFKTLVLTAIFGYFLPLLAESIPPEACAYQGRCIGYCRLPQPVGALAAQ